MDLYTEETSRYPNQNQNINTRLYSIKASNYMSMAYKVVAKFAETFSITDKQVQ
jgi:hypothetical protein